MTVEIGGDSTKLGKALDESKKKSKSLQTELKQVEKLLKLDPANVELVAQKQKILTEQVEETKKRLSLLKEEQSKVNELFNSGEIGAEEYRKYQREVEQTRIELESLETQYSETMQSVNGVDLSTAKGKVGNFKDSITDLSDTSKAKMDELANNLNTVGNKIESVGTTISTTVSSAATKVLSNSVEAFEDLDEGYDIIVKKTGATDDKLESLKSTANEVFSNSTFDMTDIGNAIGEVNTRFGYTDEQLRSVSEQYLQFAKINDTDVSDSVSKSSRIMQAWNLSAENLPDLLGMITAKGQETGVSVSSLMDKVLTNNSTFKEMGLTLEESISLMAQYEKNGVNDSTALMAMKTAVKNAAREGKSLSEALSENVNDIKNASSETEALQKATALFGSRGAAEMANAIREGRIDFDNLSGSMSSYKNTVETTYKATVDPLEKSKKVINNLKLAGVELAETALKEGEPLIEDVISGVKGVTEWLKKLTPEQKKTLTKAIEIIAVVGPGVTVVGKMTKGIGNVVSILPKATSLIKGLGTAMSTNPVGAWTAAIALAVSAFASLTAAVEAYSELKWESTESAKLAAEVDKAAESLHKSTDSILDTIDDTITGLNKKVAENSLIDTYQAELDKLLGKQNLTDEEKSKLDLIVKYLTDNVDGFSDAWSKYTIKDEKTGEITLVEDLETVRKALNNTIDDFQRTSNIALLQKAYDDAYSKNFEANTQREVSKESLNNAEEHLNKLLKQRGISKDQFESVKKGYGNNSLFLKEITARLGGKVTWEQYSELFRVSESVENYKNEVEELNKALNDSDELCNDAIEGMTVLNGNYDDAAATLMMYKSRMITLEDVEKSRWGSLKALEEAAAETHKNTIFGVFGENESYKKKLEQSDDEFTKKLKASFVDNNAKYRAAVENYNSLKAQFDADVPGVTEKMVKAAEETVQKYASEFGALPDMGGKAISDTTEAVKGNTPALRRGMGSAGELARDEFTIPMKEGTDSVKDAVSGTTKAIENETPNLENASEKASEAIKNNFDNLDLEEKGGNIILGLLKGLWNNSIFSKIGETVGNVSSAIYNAFTSWWDMHSPAEKSGPLGKNITLGITEEMPNQHRAIKKASAEVNKDIMKSLSETAKSYFQGKDYLLEPTFSTLPTMTDYSVTHTHDFQQSAELRSLRNQIETLNANIDKLAKRPIDLYVDGRTFVGGTIGEIDRQLAAVEFFKNRGG